MTQGALLGLTGAICLRLAVTDDYRLYVNAWMRWPLFATAFVLLALGARMLWTRAGAGAAKGPGSAWLLMIPVMAVFAVSPPAMGAYAAGRNTVGVAADKDYGALRSTSIIVMPVGEFQGRAQWDDSLLGYRVSLTGFVTQDDAGNWYVTGLSMSCCAADAVGYRVKVEAPGVPRPEENTWVQVLGTWDKPELAEVPRLDPPILVAEEVNPTTAPAFPYE